MGRKTACQLKKRCKRFLLGMNKYLCQHKVLFMPGILLVKHPLDCQKTDISARHTLEMNYIRKMAGRGYFSEGIYFSYLYLYVFIQTLDEILSFSQHVINFDFRNVNIFQLRSLEKRNICYQTAGYSNCVTFIFIFFT